MDRPTDTPSYRDATAHLKIAALMGRVHKSIRNHCTVFWNKQESRRKYWTTRSSVRSHRSLGRLLRSPHYSLRTRALLRALVRPLAYSLTPKLVGKRMIRCLKATWFCPSDGAWMWLAGRGRGEDEEEMLDDEVFENWDSGEPNWGGKHHCVLMRYNGK